MNAGDVMTREVVTVSPDTPVLQIVKLMLARGISGRPRSAAGPSPAVRRNKREGLQRICDRSHARRLSRAG